MQYQDNFYQNQAPQMNAGIRAQNDNRGNFNPYQQPQFNSRQQPIRDPLNDSINQRDSSIDNLNSSVIEKRQSSMKNDYQSYIQEIGNSIKNKKTRVEIEREKQMQNQDVGMAQLIMNSKAHQDFQRKQYVRDVTNSPSRMNGLHNSSSPNIINNKSKAALNNSVQEISPFSNNAKMILGDYGYNQQMPRANDNFKPVTPMLSQPILQVMQPIAPQQFLNNYQQQPLQQNQLNLPLNQIQNQFMQPPLTQGSQFSPDQQFQNYLQQPQPLISPNINTAIGPPSGQPILQQNLNESFIVNQSQSPYIQPQVSHTESFKNPWITVPRPMNGFLDVNPVVYERQEKEKQDLQKVLQEQIEEKKRRVEEEKHKKLLEDQYYEQKLAKDRMELAMREQLEKQVQVQKQQKLREQNEKLFQDRIEQPKPKKRPRSPYQPEVVQNLQQETTIKESKTQQLENQVNSVSQQESQQKGIDDEKLKKELQDLSKTFKGELEGMRQIIKNQDGSLKQEVSKLLEYQKQTDQERNRTIQEIQKLREDFLKQQEQKQEQQWEQLSRSAHWTKFKDEPKQARKIIESEVKLKTILTDGYFGQDGVLLKHRKDLRTQATQKPIEPFFQSSKMLNLSNFAINKKDEQDAESIRDKNIDRLKFLQHYEETLKYKQGFQFLKYNDQEEEDNLSLRLKKMDTQLYSLLNPEQERVQMRQVPYNLTSNYDSYASQAKISNSSYREGVLEKSFRIE